MRDVVVLGAGLGGTLTAYELQRRLRPQDRLTLIGQDSSYHFVPSNPWVAVGWRDRADIETDLSKVMRRKGIRYLTQGARRLDPAARRIDMNDGASIAYDYLVIATGPDLAFDEIEGLGPDGFTQSICHIDHAVRARAAFEEFCNNPGPIVVGAVQGASCFGPAYEFAFILDTELRKRRIRDRVKMTFVTPEPYIGHLGLDGVGDTKSMLESELRSRHIGWVTNAKVQRVTPNAVAVEEMDDNGAPRKLHELPFGFAMLLPAFRGVPAIRGLDKLVNPRGFVLIDKNQANPAFPEIYGIGVCVAIPPVGPTPVPVGTPKTGFMIESMVTATATNIGRRLRNEEPSARATWNAICLADFGDGGVAFVAQPQIPPRNVNWSAKGAWVHLAKVAFEKYYLRKMRAGQSEHFFENFVLRRMNVHKLHAAE
ncbi:MAG TPA: FAD/NAD(P)-binding oxidoreductase [Acetobacteraceae bacterium]|nr:FAD/NAD(P)-binding oxidoreductase [Acetobacteraceae bacterium]